MKLLRHGPRGWERPGLLDGTGRIRDLSSFVSDIGGTALTPGGLRALAAIDPEILPVVAAGTRLGPCVAGVGKLVCVGMNYRHPHLPPGTVIPDEPVLFMKATSAICGAVDPVEIPPGASQVDWEVELGVVIGRPGRYLRQEEALEHVAGYCVVNDLSERSYQFERGGQWVKGKSCDTFAPLGPWLVTADEVGNPDDLPLWLEVDGVRRQDASTADMLFGVAELVAYISQFMSLHPGDVIATGTPPGVGFLHQPQPVFLRPGQRLRACISGLGEQCQEVVDAFQEKPCPM